MDNRRQPHENTSRLHKDTQRGKKTRWKIKTQLDAFNVSPLSDVN